VADDLCSACLIEPLLTGVPKVCWLINAAAQARAELFLGAVVQIARTVPTTSPARPRGKRGPHKPR
jgi:hypothetical protein